MLGRKNYAQEEIDAARPMVEEAFELEQGAAHKSLKAKAFRKGQKKMAERGTGKNISGTSRMRT
jgi:hypothetical protein